MIDVVVVFMLCIYIFLFRWEVFLVSCLMVENDCFLNLKVGYLWLNVVNNLLREIN